MKYINALCLYPYFIEPSAALGFFPPTGIEYVAAALEGFVEEITLIDLRQEIEYRNTNDLVHFIRKNIDLICISVNWSYNFDAACDLINCMPEDIKLVVGGQHATNHVEELFETCPNIDIIVRGEGEETIQEIARDFNLEDIAGISYKSNGHLIHNPNRPLPPVSKLRFPNRKLRRTSYYYKAKELKMLKGRLDTLLSARGCPYNCKFCTLKINPLGQKRNYSARPPESVIQELKDIEAEIIFITDDNFFVDFERSEKILDLILEHGIKKRFVLQARLEMYKHPEILRKAEMAGFKVMLVGIESTQDRILKDLNKGFTVQEVRDGFEVLRDYAFYFHCYFIYGNIGETRENMLYIPEFAREIGADSISFQKLQVRDFSPLKSIIEETPGYYIGPFGFVYSDTYSLDDLYQIKKEIKKDFYTPNRIFKSLQKLYRIRFFKPSDLYLVFIPRIPILIYRLLAREIEKKRNKRRNRRKKQKAV